MKLYRSVITSEISAPHPYCIVKCEGKKVKGPAAAKTLDPNWKHFSAVFYRKKTSEPITVQVKMRLNIGR
jgi:hypothetical protein